MWNRAGKHRRAAVVLIVALLSASFVAGRGWAHGPAGRAAAGSPAAAAPGPGRPNVLLMIADDQTWSTFNRSLMPNVYSQIADEGVLFKQAYVNSSLCCPSRASILSGLYATNSGVSANIDPLTRPTVVQALHDSGYRTLLAGKYLNSSPCSTVLPEFDDWYCYGEDNAAQTNPIVNVNGEYRPYSGYAVDVFADFVTHFVDTTPASQPFFAIYSPKVPHLPPNDHRHDDLPVPTYRPPSFDEDTTHDGKPAMFRRGPLTDREISALDESYAGMYHTSRSLDDATGTILSSLGSRADNTLVIYLSDNGFLYGEHRIEQGKEVAYQPSVNVPMAIRYPRLRPTANASVSDALVQNTDVAPTIANAAGIAWNADGTSLLPLVRGTRSKVRNSAVIERCVSSYGRACAPAGSSPYFFGVVTDRYKYVESFTGERELYDLDADPWELDNLAGRPAVAGVQASLAAQAAALRAPPPPVVTIVTGPTGTIRSDAPAVFTYFSPGIDATYRCRLDRNSVVGAWKACGNQASTLGPLREGNYQFRVEAVTAAGIVGTQAAVRSFTVSSLVPALTISDGSVVEGDGGNGGKAISFDISLDMAPQTPVFVKYETTDLTAFSPEDYTRQSGMVKFAKQQTTSTITVPVIGDALHESDETFRLTLFSIRNAAVARASAIGTIVDDDAAPSISAGGASAPEGAPYTGGTLQIPITLSAPSGATVTVAYATSNGSAHAGGDYLGTKGKLTLPAGTNSVTVPVHLVGDNVHNGDRQFTLTLSSPTGASLASATATGTIVDDDPAPKLSIGDTDAVETNGADLSVATFHVTVTGPTVEPITVGWKTVDGTAKARSDYLPRHGTQRLAVGTTGFVIAVPVVGDSFVEGAETFSVVLANPTNAELDRAVGVATIIDDDSPPVISVADVTTHVNGGSAVARFHLTLPFAADAPVTVDYHTVDGTATAPAGYADTEGTATFVPGDTDVVVAVPVQDDGSGAAYESFRLALSDPSGGTLVNTSATATIVVDVNLPVVGVQPGPSVTEGDAHTTVATFRFVLGQAASQPVRVSYATSDGTATAGVDYLPRTGTVTIAPGDTAANVVVPVVGDRVFENNETFKVTLSDPVGARLGFTNSIASIIDDDPLPNVAVADDAVVSEGNSGTTPAVFTIVLSSLSAFPTGVTYATTDETAVSPGDYTETDGELTIPPGVISATVPVPVVGDTLYEGDEHFLLTVVSTSNARVNDDGYAAFGVITDDDPMPTVSIADRSVVEGDRSVTTADRLVMSLSAASGLPVTVNFTTLDDTATAGDDYIARIGHRTLPAGTTSTKIAIEVIGDNIAEPDETFVLQLSDPVGARLGRDRGIGTILNDDGPPGSPHRSFF